MGLTVFDLHAWVFCGAEPNSETRRCLGELLNGWAKDIKTLGLTDKSRQASDGSDAGVRRQCELSPVALPLLHGSNRAVEKEGATLPEPRRKKAFDIHGYHSRYVALKVMYVGWAYFGSTYQPNEVNTVEGKIMAALKRTRLIAEDASIASIQLSRSGRTDRGVSGLGQVIAVRVRSKALVTSAQLQPADDYDYPMVLNRVLPSDIRVLGWSDVPESFSARFSAQYREYRYFIPHNGNLDLVAMQRAAQYFVGEHDFRNFCKIDAEHVKHFVRRILDFQPTKHVRRTVLLLSMHVEGLRANAFRAREVTIFFLCQLRDSFSPVRCMVAVLQLVGSGLEAPEVVRQLLSVEDFGCKPQYRMADDEPLLFYCCGYASLECQATPESAAASRAAVEDMLHKHMARVAVLHTILTNLGQADTPSVAQSDQHRRGKHVLLRSRAREPSLESKFAKYGKILERPMLKP